MSVAAFIPNSHLVVESQEDIISWLEEHRVMTKKEGASDDGPISLALTPYLREPLLAFQSDYVNDLTLKAPAQSGKTAGFACNCLAYSIVEWGDPAMIVLPRDEDCAPYGRKRIRPMFEQSPKFQEVLTGKDDDVSGKEFLFLHTSLRLSGANSPADLASDTRRVVILDEKNKYPRFSGKEANPSKLAQDRCIPYWQTRKIVNISTSTTQDGQISQDYDRAWSKRRYWVPCPKCKEYAPMAFSKQEDPITGFVAWPKGATAEQIKKLDLAWYECGHCHHHMNNLQRLKIVQRGIYCEEGLTINRKGRPSSPQEFKEYMAWHIHGLMTPFLTISDLASEFLETKDEPEDHMDFINSKLGEDYIVKGIETKDSHIQSRCKLYALGEVPNEARVLVAGIDVQQNEFYYVIRAFAHRERSWLVRYGRLGTFEDIEEAILEKEFDVGGTKMRVRLTNMDAGFRTDEVYAFCLKHLERCRPVKGYQNQAMAPIRASRIEMIGKKLIRYALHLWTLDVSYFKDKLNRLIHTEIGEPGEWSLPEEVSKEYSDQMTAEHKIKERNKHTGRVREIWKLKSQKRANHYFDCEVYATAAADMLKVYRLKAPEPEEKVSNESSSRPGKPSFVNKWR